MTDRPISMMTRRMGLLAPLALAGCETIEGWFNTKKDPLPGKREEIGAVAKPFSPDPASPGVTLPAAARNAAWAQAGGNPSHLMGHMALGAALTPAWSAELGEGGGYRKKILAQPVVADGVVYAMDSDSAVTAWNLVTGTRRWRTATIDKDIDSTNVGGGLAVEAGTVFAVNGMSELLALSAAQGTVKWRKNLGVPARSAPTVAEGKVFLVTIDSKLVALSADDGHELWSYQATTTATTVLGAPAPAYAQGIVVAGFGSGEIAALRAEAGGVAWTDGLGISRGKASLVDFLTIRGAPVIANGQVYATGMGGLTVALDLVSGRRVWERKAAGENTPFIAGGWLFMLTLDQDIGAINIEDARVNWVTALPRWANPEKKKNALTWYGPVLAGDRLIVTGSNSEAIFISPTTGQILSRQKLSAVAAPFAPVVVDGTMLIVTEDGRLTAWR